MSVTCRQICVDYFNECYKKMKSVTDYDEKLCGSRCPFYQLNTSTVGNITTTEVIIITKNITVVDYLTPELDSSPTVMIGLATVIALLAIICIVLASLMICRYQRKNKKKKPEKKTNEWDVRRLRVRSN